MSTGRSQPGAGAEHRPNYAASTTRRPRRPRAGGAETVARLGAGGGAGGAERTRSGGPDGPPSQSVCEIQPFECQVGEDRGLIGEDGVVEDDEGGVVVALSIGGDIGAAR